MSLRLVTNNNEPQSGFYFKRDVDYLTSLTHHDNVRLPVLIKTLEKIMPERSIYGVLGEVGKAIEKWPMFTPDSCICFTFTAPTDTKDGLLMYLKVASIEFVVPQAVLIESIPLSLYEDRDNQRVFVQLHNAPEKQNVFGKVLKLFKG